MTWNPVVGKTRGACGAAATGCKSDENDMAWAVAIVNHGDIRVVIVRRQAREGITGLFEASVKGCRRRREAARKTRRANIRCSVNTLITFFWHYALRRGRAAAECGVDLLEACGNLLLLVLNLAHMVGQFYPLGAVVPQIATTPALFYSLIDGSHVLMAVGGKGGNSSGQTDSPARFKHSHQLL
jgi:hypothetical protein